MRSGKAADGTNIRLTITGQQCEHGVLEMITVLLLHVRAFVSRSLGDRLPQRHRRRRSLRVRTAAVRMSPCRVVLACCVVLPNFALCRLCSPCVQVGGVD